MSRFLYTGQAGADNYMAAELNDTETAWAPLAELESGTLLASGDFEAISRTFQKRPPIFIRHICPVDREVQLAGDMRDIERLQVAAAELKALPEGARFSVQSRLLYEDKREYRPYHIHKALGERWISGGAILDVQNPEWVLSAELTADKAYLGVSRLTQNLSSWPGGMCRFKYEDSQISRAEFKLLEACSVFGLRFPEGGQALDLGAAPGGWTRVLRQKGLAVAAVDPAALDDRILQDPGVKHFRMLAQQYLHEGLSFDVIVNDMRMDAQQSAELMVSAAPYLRDGGTAVMTLKLPEHNQRKLTQRALSILRGSYQLIGCRQLFHNRSEVTAVLCKKENI